jgi:hypothetical protein
MIIKELGDLKPASQEYYTGDHAATNDLTNITGMYLSGSKQEGIKKYSFCF